MSVSNRLKPLMRMALTVALSAAAITGLAEGSKAMERPERTLAKVTALSEQGDKLASQAKYGEAVIRYLEALALLPEPKTRWGACTWLLAAIGDANFLGGHYEQAKSALTDAMHCPGGIGNPFIHLRLGQAQLELGNRERAGDELTRAYMGAGREIFAAEKPKYFEFLKTVLKPPANGQW
jgi:tetratricopeptide (TPR) repeat protein